MRVERLKAGSGRVGIIWREENSLSHPSPLWVGRIMKDLKGNKRYRIDITLWESYGNEFIIVRNITF